MPVAIRGEGLEWLDYRHNVSGPISDEMLATLEKRVVSEVLLTDWQHEGQPQGFDQRLVQQFPINNVSLIAFGGISKPARMIELLRQPNLSAVAVGNFLNYHEHAIQHYKEALASMSLRASAYESGFSLLAGA